MSKSRAAEPFSSLVTFLIFVANAPLSRPPTRYRRDSYLLRSGRRGPSIWTVSGTLRGMATRSGSIGCGPASPARWPRCFRSSRPSSWRRSMGRTWPICILPIGRRNGSRVQERSELPPASNGRLGRWLKAWSVSFRWFLSGGALTVVERMWKVRFRYQPISRSLRHAAK